MPIYEYDCSSCQSAFDLLVSISDRDRPVVCPDCGSSKTQRKVSRFFARSAKSDGATQSVGGSSCGSCSSSSCSSCCKH